MPNNTIPSTRADKAAIKQIRNEGVDGVKVTLGTTNGQRVYHVHNGQTARTIKPGEWASCRLNGEFLKAEAAQSGDSAERAREIMDTEALIANRDAI